MAQGVDWRASIPRTGRFLQGNAWLYASEQIQNLVLGSLHEVLTMTDDSKIMNKSGICKWDRMLISAGAVAQPEG